jgi:regulator of sirC expression with transglutaminase-like and TPR domain
MNENKFNALIRLLDDNDPHVSEQVESELFQLGSSGIPRLEKAWESVEDLLIQSRLEELIYKIQVGQYSQELYDWRVDGGRDLLEGWLPLTQIQYPTLNVQKYRNEINRLVSRIWLQTNGGMNDLEKLCAVNKLLYNLEKYSGNYKEPDRADNNQLSVVLDAKKGNSLSLSALYYLICHQLEIPLQVVNFMGYYALRYYHHNSHFYIDAYNKGMFFTPQQVQQFLKKLKVEQNVYHYKPLSNIYVVLKLIQQLVSSYRQSGLEEKAQVYEQLARDIDIRFTEPGDGIDTIFGVQPETDD